MRMDNETTASHDRERSGVRCLQQYNCSSAENVWIEILQQQILTDDRAQDEEKRMEWAHENLHKKFENIVWTSYVS